MQNIISDPDKLERIKEKIKAGGFGKLQVVSDFDGTLISHFVNGKKVGSLVSILRKENHLTPDYTEKARALSHKYSPMENDPCIPPEEKKELMHTWWSKHYNLLIEAGLRQSDLEKVIQSQNLALRPGAEELLDFLYTRDVPLVVFSASGLGAETISLYLGRHGKLKKNVHIVSNSLIFNDEGLMTGAREPIIHTFNKNYATIEKCPEFIKLKNRKNIILLGDNLGDADMMEGFEYDAIIKIGFLNKGADNDNILRAFKKKFDVVILNDGAMDCVNEVLKSL